MNCISVQCSIENSFNFCLLLLHWLWGIGVVVWEGSKVEDSCFLKKCWVVKTMFQNCVRNTMFISDCCLYLFLLTPPDSDTIWILSLPVETRHQVSAPQPPWTTSLSLSPWCLSWCLNDAFCVSARAHHLLSCHRAPLERAWLCISGCVFQESDPIDEISPKCSLL